MNNPETIEIHEFSTGIRAETTSDGGWVSRGFTGKYMNMTLESIPDVVERSIRNREFALTEGASSDSPAIIGRVVGNAQNVWSVMAVVTRGKDEKGRSLSVYRYFLCEGENLRFIIAWWENQGTPIFNPFDSKTIGQFSLFNKDSAQPPDLQQEFHDLRVDLPEPILLTLQQQYNLQTINVLAIKKFNVQNNGQPVSWAINVEALEQPKRFQVIQPASQRAYEILERTIRNTPQVLAPVVGDEEALKSAIRGLINSSQVKQDAVKTITDALQNQQISKQYWHSLFDGQGAKTAISQKIYSPQMIRLITLRAMVIPDTLPEFLDWLNVKGGRNTDQNQALSLDFQAQIRNLKLFPKEKLADGIKFILPQLLAKKITPETVGWLLTIKTGSVWAVCRQNFLNDIINDLQLIENYSKSPQGNTREAQTSLSSNFQCGSEIWRVLVNHYKSIQYGSRLKLPSFKALAELFEYMEEYALSAYFYQVSDGVVPKDIFYEVAQLANGTGNTLTFLGLKLHRKVSALKKFLDFIYRSKVSLSIITGLVLLAIVVTEVLKSLPEFFNTSNNRRAKERSITMGPDQVSKQNDSGEETSSTNPISNKKKEVALNNFAQTKNAIEQLFTKLEEEGLKKDEIKRELKNVLNNSNLDYAGAFEKNNQVSKEAWIEAIYKYQESKNSENAHGFINTPDNQNGAKTYQDLKEDIKFRLSNRENDINKAPEIREE